MQLRAALSRRQSDVIALMSEGHSRQSAADALGLSENTVKRHLDEARTKLDARTTAHAVAIYIRNKLRAPQ